MSQLSRSLKSNMYFKCQTLRSTIQNQSLCEFSVLYHHLYHSLTWLRTSMHNKDITLLSIKWLEFYSVQKKNAFKNMHHDISVHWMIWRNYSDFTCSYLGRFCLWWGFTARWPRSPDPMMQVVEPVMIAQVSHWWEDMASSTLTTTWTDYDIFVQES